MSHTFSDRATQPKSYVGIGLVVALHLAGIYALSAGLITVPPRVRELATVRTLPPEAPEPPKPFERVRPAEPKLSTPEPILVPPPIVEIAQPPQEPVISAVPQRDATPTTSGPTVSTGTTTPAQTQKKTDTISTPSAVCSVMPRPDVPVVNWSGEAVLQVIATVRGGRVVGTDFRVAQGALDSKTRRSLQRSVESALSGYQCQGDATFQQDFAFRLD
ncbi:hypothetical protein J2X20_003960 [Pelomonas saccharophila]|uniref:Ig-like domain-containing protein n=1 Tax=Roseateles saccharophilus TaxID=304 RepID=A0ABU1YQZ9_ROSSA|nr:hypothetical protein [Roseateles saccharophilus]MDR7271292.1 hypothetical protein [Roseateles saccharophilus]